MRQLYLECSMGAAGDMLMAALLELYTDKEGFLKQMNSLGLPGVTVECVPAQKCGILGSHVRVTVNGEEEIAKDVEPYGSYNHEYSHDHDHDQEHSHDHNHKQSHHHCNYEDIVKLIERLPLPEQVKTHAIAVYSLIREAESQVHGIPVEQIHFHEVGTLDSVADVVGCCLLLHLLEVDSITASPVHVGSGFVHCAHGVLPVPAPATAHLLLGIPSYGGNIQGELCTPTGAALLKHFVSKFGPMPPMAAEKIGCGMGSKDFEAANCLRAFLGANESCSDTIVELRCNLDDMTPEAVGIAMELLLKNGALDVFITPIQMKKCRPAVMLTCLCKEELNEALTQLMLLHTSTLGVRKTNCTRTILHSTFFTVETSFGAIRIKKSSGLGVVKYKPEYSDVRDAAEKHGAAFDTVYKQAVAAVESF
jgi:pyridinium-3,5-bisthiocarboxylic acid mononucleotide nickel chelatase